MRGSQSVVANYRLIQTVFTVTVRLLFTVHARRHRAFAGLLKAGEIRY
jgi:hypothetical protein